MKWGVHRVPQVLCMCVCDPAHTPAPSIPVPSTPPHTFLPPVPASVPPLHAQANQLVRKGQHAYAKARYERIFTLMNSTRDWENDVRGQHLALLRSSWGCLVGCPRPALDLFFVCCVWCVSWLRCLGLCVAHTVPYFQPRLSFFPLTPPHPPTVAPSSDLLAHIHSSACCPLQAPSTAPSITLPSPLATLPAPLPLVLPVQDQVARMDAYKVAMALNLALCSLALGDPVNAVRVGGLHSEEGL